MKIIGITYYDGSENIVLKSDSSMLVNRKPLFVPEWVGRLQALPCYVLRVSRLGKCIAPRFASRYFDAVATGMDFFAADQLHEAQLQGKAWTQAIAFEGSLALGEWQSVPMPESRWQLLRNGEQVCELDWMPDPDIFCQAVARASNLLTIRQGDLIYVAAQQQPWQLITDDIVRSALPNTELLYCKIK
ncbi:MAG: hypothetical protein IJQ97_02680 [Paludibacteraceae bacterium]|nr:hypothetical protein [Paludibacteraceae bacterium]